MSKKFQKWIQTETEHATACLDVFPMLGVAALMGFFAAPLLADPKLELTIAIRLFFAALFMPLGIPLKLMHWLLIGKLTNSLFIPTDEDTKHDEKDEVEEKVSDTNGTAGHL